MAYDLNAIATTEQVRGGETIHYRPIMIDGLPLSAAEAEACAVLVLCLREGRTFSRTADGVSVDGRTRVAKPSDALDGARSR